MAQSRLWKSGTLCITIAANIADTAILGIDACFPDSIIGFIPKEEKADTRFIKYLFDGFLQQRFQRFTQGAAQDNLSESKLLSLKFPIPDVTTQKRIADALEPYDSLIENNRRRIQLLEQAARLFYKEWFVRFRFPGHEHVKIKDGVPEGWEMTPLSQMCEDIREQVDPSKVDPDTPHIGLEHMPRRSITLSDWGLASKVVSSKFQFLSGDILFGKIRPYFHKVGVALTDGITSSDAIVVRPLQKWLDMYVLFLLSSDEFVALASKTVREGSKMPRADWAFLVASPFLLPPRSTVEAFVSITNPMVIQLRTLALQNRQLACARDLLLPRLMNGEIAV